MGLCPWLVPTERAKILRVDRAMTPAPRFDDGIRELIAAAARGDAEALRVAVDGLEPGFTERGGSDCG